jgi:hypothetical protein
MLPNQSEGHREGPPTESVVLREFDVGIEPKLRLGSITLNVDVKPRFFP